MKIKSPSSSFSNGRISRGESRIGSSLPFLVDRRYLFMSRARIEHGARSCDREASQHSARTYNVEEERGGIHRLYIRLAYIHLPTQNLTGKGIRALGCCCPPPSAAVALSPDLSLWPFCLGEDEAPGGGGAGDGDHGSGVPERAGEGRPPAGSAGAPQLLGHLPVSNNQHPAPWSCRYIPRSLRHLSTMLLIDRLVGFWLGRTSVEKYPDNPMLGRRRVVDGKVTKNGLLPIRSTPLLAAS